MTKTQAIEQEIAMLEAELRGIESERLRLAGARFEKMLAIADRQEELRSLHVERMRIVEYEMRTGEC